MKIVSACLAGTACRYDGTAFPDEKVLEMVRQGKAIPVCPEQLGGLPTPREASEIVDGRVKTSDGNDVTAQFRRGAEEALRIAELAGCRSAVLKSRSPSCGCGKIYDGCFSGRLTEGNGIFAGMLLKAGFEVKTEENS